VGIACHIEASLAFTAIALLLTSSSHSDFFRIFKHNNQKHKKWKLLQKHHKLATYKDKKGKAHITKPYCEYEILALGNIHIRDIKSMKLVKTIPVSGGASQSIDTANRRVHSCNDLSNTETSSLVCSAGKK